MYVSSYGDSYIIDFVGFISELRSKGLSPGFSETMDSLRAVELTGLADRDDVMLGMASCLAKSQREINIFEDIFNEYFTSLENRRSQTQMKINQIEVQEKKLKKSEEDLQFQGEALELPEDLMQTYAELSEEDQFRIKNFLEKTSTGKNVGPKFKKLTENVIRNKLSGMRASMPSQAINADSLLYKRISNIDDEELPQALLLIHDLVRQINRKIARHFKRTSRAAALDMKSTIHQSLNTGGIMYNLKFKKRPKRKQKLLLLCDISGSMYRFSGFALQFIRSMSKIADKAETFIFSEGAEKIELSSMTDIETFESRVFRSSLWRRGTNLATALEHILNPKNCTLNSSTIVLIFSDAKTLEIARTEQLLQVISKKARSIIFMNPIPKDEWKNYSFVKHFSQHCKMLDTSTLDALATACADSAIR